MSDIPDREGDPSYKAPRAAYTLADFKLIRRLGDGSYSQVVQAHHLATDTDYALKMIDKGLIIRNKQTVYVKTERTLLDLFEYPGIVNLYFTFQDQHSLYLGLTLCHNGELYDQIRRKEKLSLEAIQFYAAEIVLILQYMRRHKVVHRDLKPENLLLDEAGHILLCDFGSAKILQPAKASASSRNLGSKPDSTTPTAQSLGPSPTHSGTLAPLVPESVAAPSAAAAATAAPPALPTAAASSPPSNTQNSTPASAAASAPTQPPLASLLDADVVTPAGNPFDGPHSSAPPSGASQPAHGDDPMLQHNVQLSQSTVAAMDAAAASTAASGGSAELTAGLGAQLEQLAIGVEASDAQHAGTDDEGAPLPRVTSMVGTADYIAPETLENEEVTCAADLWSFGCVLFQMAAGKPPFKAASEYLTFNKISAAEFQFPKGFPTPVADLVGQLLVLKPAERLGAAKIADLMEHPLFEGIEWETLRESKAPSFLPPEWLDEEAEGGDWELSSLMGAAAAAITGNSSETKPTAAPKSSTPETSKPPATLEAGSAAAKPAPPAHASPTKAPSSITQAVGQKQPPASAPAPAGAAAAAPTATHSAAQPTSPTSSKPVGVTKPSTAAHASPPPTHPPTHPATTHSSTHSATAHSTPHASASAKPGQTTTAHAATHSAAGAAKPAAAHKVSGWQGMGQEASAGAHAASQHASQSSWQDGSAGNSLLAAGAVMQILGRNNQDTSFEF